MDEEQEAEYQRGRQRVMEEEHDAEWHQHRGRQFLSCMLTDMTRLELQRQCKRHSLNPDGTHEELLDRLVEEYSCKLWAGISSEPSSSQSRVLANVRSVLDTAYDASIGMLPRIIKRFSTAFEPDSNLVMLDDSMSSLDERASFETMHVSLVAIRDLVDGLSHRQLWRKCEKAGVPTIGSHEDLKMRFMAHLFHEGAQLHEVWEREDLGKCVGEEFVCPISLELPVQPIVARDGGIYERSAFQAYIDLQRSSNRIIRVGSREYVLSPLTSQYVGTTLMPAPHITNLLKFAWKHSHLPEDVASPLRQKLSQEDKKELALNGCAWSATRLAFEHQFGNQDIYGTEGVGPNYAEAMKWWKVAAELDDTVGLAMYGSHLVQGQLAHERNLGISYLTKAALRKNRIACLALGIFYSETREQVMASWMLHKGLTIPRNEPWRTPFPCRQYLDHCRFVLNRLKANFRLPRTVAPLLRNNLNPQRVGNVGEIFTFVEFSQENEQQPERPQLRRSPSFNAISEPGARSDFNLAAAERTVQWHRHLLEQDKLAKEQRLNAKLDLLVEMHHRQSPSPLPAEIQ